MIKRIGIDTEGTGLDPHTAKMLLFTLCDDAGNEYFWKTQEEELPQWVLDMLVNPDIMVIIHNAAFDTKLIKHVYGVVVTNIWDTMLISELLNLGNKDVKHKLSDVLKSKYGIVLDKAEIENFLKGIVTDKGIKMGMEDTRYLLTLQESQEIEVQHEGIMANAARIENEVSYVFGQMEYNGMPTNIPLYLSYISRVRVMLRDVKRTILDILEYPYTLDLLDDTKIHSDFNLNSSKQKTEALKRYGIPLDSSSKEALKGYLYKCKDGTKRILIQSLLEYSTWQKVTTWKYEDAINPVTGRLHPQYKSLGARTGRASSKNPNGQNIMNEAYVLERQEDGTYIPKATGINFRNPFEAPQGWKHIGADYSQMELRIYAGVARVASILEEYSKENSDLHRQAASYVFNVPYESIEEDSHERTLGKILNFAARAYGGGPNAIITAALNYGVTLTWDEAKELGTKLLKGDPEGVTWGREVTEQAKEEGYMWNLAGYRRYIPIELCSPTRCKNNPIQGLGGAILKEAMISFQRWIDKVPGSDNVQLISQIHDELNCIARDSWADRTLKELRRCMLDAGNKYMEPLGVTCAVDGYIADRWKK